MTATQRTVARLVPSMPTSDGAGVRLRRSIGAPGLEELDPFLLLDSIGSDEAADYIAGFPEHPHRGFETVTYMLEGRMRHRDSGGNEGVLVPGGAQWMTAGRGILHSEMPEQESGRLHGFQLWVNLPAVRKMTAPRYQNIEPDEIPEVALAGGGRARVVAGTAFGVTGPVTGIDVDPLFIDLRLAPGAQETVAVPDGHTLFLYGIAGTVLAPQPVPADTLAILHGSGPAHLTGGDQGAHLLLVAGRPLGEPVARYGPFVMNTHDELVQAVADLRSGRFLG
ncbi:MAG: pirin family protein [Rhodobacterales bacterium]|nr:pirin family protein [Rhodobacterales bacterium]